MSEALTEPLAAAPIDVPTASVAVPAHIAKKQSALRTILTGLWHRIPIELAFTVNPTTKAAILKEFHERTKEAAIKQKVTVMLGLLRRHFPTPEEGSQTWMYVRAHFFGEVGLWGKTG